MDPKRHRRIRLVRACIVGVLLALPLASHAQTSDAPPPAGGVLCRARLSRSRARQVTRLRQRPGWAAPVTLTV
jgi:hypothetical protein